MQLYPSKLLLFGEHTIINGSQALAIPLWQYGGGWDYSENASDQLDLKKLSIYLKNCVENGDFLLDTEGFARELDKGLYFKSNIPQGYGVGSSGALIAAIYRVFSINRKMRGLLTNEDLPDLKTILGKMESFFHGASSGFDPLISFIKKPILIKRDRSMAVLNNPDFLNQSAISIFLLDTQIPRKGELMIKIFQDKIADTHLNALIINELVPSVDEAIAGFLGNLPDVLFESVHNISHWQYRFFAEAIPEAFRNIWLESLSSDVFKLKICGAGGGGFILGFSRNIPLTRKRMQQLGYKIIEVTF